MSTATNTMHEKIAQARQAITEGVLALTSSDKWRQQLDAMAVLSRVSVGRLSFGNMILVSAQAEGYRQCPTCQRWGLGTKDLKCPDCGAEDIKKPVNATQVATYKTWEGLGRQVKKGSRAMMILRPQIAKKVKEEAEPTGDNGEDENGKAMYFRAMSVFSIDQTEGEPLPELQSPEIQEDGKDYSLLFDRLTQWAISAGIVAAVEVEEARTDGTHGLYIPKQNMIKVYGDKAQPNQLATLAHELGHAVAGHGSPEAEEKNRGDREIVAESVAYCVCKALGLSTEAFSFDYVASWATDKKTAQELASGSAEAVKTLRKRIEATGNRVAKLTHQILEGLGLLGEQGNGDNE